MNCRKRDLNVKNVTKKARQNNEKTEYIFLLYVPNINVLRCRSV